MNARQLFLVLEEEKAQQRIGILKLRQAETLRIMRSAGFDAVPRNAMDVVIADGVYIDMLPVDRVGNITRYNVMVWIQNTSYTTTVDLHGHEEEDRNRLRLMVHDLLRKANV